MLEPSAASDGSDSGASGARTWEPMTLDGTAVLLEGHCNDQLQRSGDPGLLPIHLGQ